MRSVINRLSRRHSEPVVSAERRLLHVDVRPDTEQGGYFASVRELPGCVTDGDNLEELQEHVADAITTYLRAQQPRRQVKVSFIEPSVERLGAAATSRQRPRGAGRGGQEPTPELEACATLS